jgi:hypothetical protein
MIADPHEKQTRSIMPIFSSWVPEMERGGPDPFVTLSDIAGRAAASAANPRNHSSFPSVSQAKGDLHHRRLVSLFDRLTFSRQNRDPSR